MLLFVGLGNPTPDSENNRHNVGFKIIDAINKQIKPSTIPSQAPIKNANAISPDPITDIFFFLIAIIPEHRDR